MANGSGEHNLLVRPTLGRSRSHTLPSTTPDQAGDRTEPDTLHNHTSRPGHGRSNSSYLSPTDPRPRAAQTLPTEKSSRLHLPGSSKHGENRLHRHKHTQSHAEVHHRMRGHEDERLPHLVAGLAAEREKRQQLERLGTNPGDLWHRPANDLKRMASSRTGPMNPGDEARRRATSDPRAPYTNLVRKTSTEALLDRAEARKIANRAALSHKDIEQLKRAQDVAEDELRNRVSDLDHFSNAINGRLDEGFYDLLAKLNNLKGTIESFQNLTTQSQHLISNFEHETNKLDEDINRRVRRFRDSFSERQQRVEDLEQRGRAANSKAKDLSIRLDNARVIVDNWEKREAASKQKWGRFWILCWWTFVVALGIVFSVVIAKEWWFDGDPVNAGLKLPPEGSRNKSLGLDQSVVRNVEVPEDVRKILEDIEERRRTKKIWPGLPEVDPNPNLRDRRKDEKKLRELDEL